MTKRLGLPLSSVLELRFFLDSSRVPVCDLRAVGYVCFATLGCTNPPCIRPTELYCRRNSMLLGCLSTQTKYGLVADEDK